MLQEVSQTQAKWPLEGAASLFMPSKPVVMNTEGQQEVELSEDDLIRGAASGIAQNILENAVEEVLKLYPPPVKKKVSSTLL